MLRPENESEVKFHRSIITGQKKMEITRSNFKSKLPLILSAIQEASFIAIDGEFTGLNNGKNLHGYDTPEERYQKLRDGAMEFLLIQFGLSTFKYLQETDSYEARSFNFYIFPRQYGRQYPDVRFLNQSSSIDFLSNIGFDFNKLFKQGIPYLRRSDEQKLREELEQKHSIVSTKSSIINDDENKKTTITVPDELKSFINDVCQKIEDLLKSENESLNLDPCNAFLRKLIYQQVKSRYSSGIYIDTRKNNKSNEQYIMITKADQEKIKNMEMEKKKAELEELENAIGFSKVIQMISQSEKLVVGHNMILDVCHAIHQFVAPLPADYEEFKNLARCVFLKLIDTKLMASMHPFKDKILSTNLSDLLDVLDKPPFVKANVVFADNASAYSKSSELLHEAGYDSYITGVCFATMASYLNSLQKDSVKHIIPESPLLEPFLNKLFLMMIQDIPYMNLSGSDLEPIRDNVFHVTFPKEWKTSDLCQLFQPFGSVYVAWINDNSAFVSLNKKNQSAVVMKTLTQSDVYQVLSYQEYVTRQRNRLTLSNSRSRPIGNLPKKRPYVDSDAEVHLRKKRCTDFRHSIDPIPEEEEMQENSESSSSDSNDVSDEVDIETAEEGKSDNEPLFNEPKEW